MLHEAINYIFFIRFWIDKTLDSDPSGTDYCRHTDASYM